MKCFGRTAFIAALALPMLFSGCNSSTSSSTTTSSSYVFLQAPELSSNTQLALSGNVMAQRKMIQDLRKNVKRAVLMTKARRALLKAGIVQNVAGVSVSEIDLYLVKASSSSPVKLNTNSSITFTGASLSPDGTEVAYTALDSSQTSQLYIASVNNFSQPTQLTSGSTYDYAYPVFSPDGQTISTTVATVTSNSGTLGIALIPATGGQKTLLNLGTSAGLAGAAVFTPDGAHLVFSAAPTTALQQPAFVAIFECNLDGSSVKQLSNPSDSAYYDLLPSVSADGSTIVFTRALQSNNSLQVSANIVSIPITGETSSTAAKQLTKDNLSIGGRFIGSASGSKIVYTDVNLNTSGASPSFAGTALYEMNSDGSNPQQVTNVTGGGVLP